MTIDEMEERFEAYRERMKSRGWLLNEFDRHVFYSAFQSLDAEKKNLSTDTLSPCGECDAGIYDFDALNSSAARQIRAGGAIPRCKMHDRVCIGALDVLNAHKMPGDDLLNAAVHAYKVACVARMAMETDSDGEPSADVLNASIREGVRAVLLSVGVPV